MPSIAASYPIVVQTPNGGGVCYGRTADGVLVRHAKGAEIDKRLTVEVISRSNKSGWLVVYRQEDVKNGS